MRVPRPFDLELVVRSHGWYDLPPWTWVPERRLLSRPLRLGGGKVVLAEVAERDGEGGGLAIRITSAGSLEAAAAAEARRQLRTALALDEDLSPFWRRIGELEGERARRRLPDLRWAAARGAGRLLRSPTVFEDLVKMLCTTNCSWGLTRTMVRNLVERLGEPGPDGVRAFPTAAAMANEPARFYRGAVRAGYRALWMGQIARGVASGRLDVESWRDPSIPGAELAERIRALPGFGPYATEGMLRLLGRHGHLALDSWIRPKLRRLRGLRRPPSDRTICGWYAPYREWAGLALWLEVTADWFGDRPTWTGSA